MTKATLIAAAILASLPGAPESLEEGLCAENRIFGIGVHVYRLCCSSGDCDTTVCVQEGAHVECVEGKANAICDSY